MPQGTSLSAALRVRLACMPGGRRVIDAAWELEPFLAEAARDAAVGRRVAQLVARMRRLGCRCPFDLEALERVGHAVGAGARRDGTTFPMSGRSPVSKTASVTRAP